MLPNVLQYPVAMFGVLRAGLVVVNTNPLYTARELEHQLKDSGAKAIVILENFAHVLQEVIAHTDVRKVLVTAVGDMLGWPKSAIVNFVVRHKRKQVRPWNIPGALEFQGCARGGQRPAVLHRSRSATPTSRFFSTRAARPACRRARCSRTGTSSRTCCRRGRGSGRPFRRSASVLITPLPLYHIFALTANCLLFMLLGWKNMLITNPRDFPAFVAELKKYPFSFHHRREHAVQRAAATRRVSSVSISVSCR